MPFAVTTQKIAAPASIPAVTVYCRYTRWLPIAANQNRASAKRSTPFTPRRAAVVFHALHTAGSARHAPVAALRIPDAKGAPSRASRSSSTSTTLLYPTAQILPNWQKSKNAPNTGIESPRYNSASNAPSGYNSCMVCPSGVPEYTPDRISFISTSSFKS